MVGYTDLDWIGDLDDRKSTSSYNFHLGFGPICWQSKKQHAIYLSSTNVEYREDVNTTTKAIWLQHILIEFGFSTSPPIVLHCDNQSAIAILKNLVQHQQTKNIKIHMYYI